jgi:signal transduction histidine kinase
LKIIDEEADRLRELIDSLLDSSRLQAGTMQMQFQNIRLDTFLRDIAMRARTRHEKVKLDQQTLKEFGTGRCNRCSGFDNLLVNRKICTGSQIISLDVLATGHVGGELQPGISLNI